MGEKLLVIHLREPLLHGGVPVILDGVVSPAAEVFGDLCPAVAQTLVGKEEKPFFLVLPVILFDIGVEVIVPSFSALLADATYVDL